MTSDSTMTPSRREFLGTTTAAGLGGFALTQHAPARAAIVQTDFSKLPPFGNGTLPAGIRSRQIANVNGMTVHILEAGYETPGRPAVLLLHGFLDHAWTWEPVVDAGLGDAGLRLIAPDLRGHGDSDWVGPGGYYHFVDYLADVHELVALAAPRQLSIVGHSMGGSVAAYYAGSYPERVHKLALLEGLGPPETNDPMPARVARWIKA